MRRPEIIGLPVMLAHLSMPNIAQAPAMPEDVERSSIPVRQILRRFRIRLGIVQKDASLVGGLTVKDSANLDVSAHEPMFRGREFNPHRPRRKCSCWTFPACRRSERVTTLGSRHCRGRRFARFFRHQLVPPAEAMACAAALS